MLTLMPRSRQASTAGTLMTYANSGGYQSTVGVWPSSGDLYLRLVRSGNTFTGSVSADGSSWTHVGTASVDVGSSPQVGIAALNMWQDNPFYADFAWFTINAP